MTGSVRQNISSACSPAQVGRSGQASKGCQAVSICVWPTGKGFTHPRLTFFKGLLDESLLHMEPPDFPPEVCSTSTLPLTILPASSSFLLLATCLEPKAWHCTGVWVSGPGPSG